MLQIRPHHLLCINFFVGKGYSNDFTKNMYNVIKQLQQNPKIKIHTNADTLCSKCPHNKLNICDDNSKVLDYDAKTLSLLNLNFDDQISWNDAQKLVSNNILEKDLLKNICGDCKWFSICSHQLKNS